MRSLWLYHFIPTAQKVDTFLTVLCLTAETLRVSLPTGPSLIARGAFALLSGPLRGPQSRPLYQRSKESLIRPVGIINQSHFVDETPVQSMRFALWFAFTLSLAGGAALIYAVILNLFDQAASRKISGLYAWSASHP